MKRRVAWHDIGCAVVVGAVLAFAVDGPFVLLGLGVVLWALARTLGRNLEESLQT